MSEEQLRAFIAKAKDDTSIQEQLKAAKTPEEVIGIAKEHGHEFTQEHMNQLSDEELEGVAGGAGAGLVCMEGSVMYGTVNCGNCWVAIRSTIP